MISLIFGILLIAILIPFWIDDVIDIPALISLSLFLGALGVLFILSGIYTLFKI